LRYNARSYEKRQTAQSTGFICKSQESNVVRPLWWTVIGLLLAGLGGLGLWLIVTQVWPDPTSQLIFLGLASLTFGGLTIPLAAYLNYRFAQSGWQKQDPLRLPRQAIWVGLFVGLCGWLQKEGALNWTIAAVIASVFALMEAFFLTRDQT
jgi:hypothetical protein